MPLDGLAELGLPIARGRGPGVRRRGRRDHGGALDLQLLPDQEPVRARRRRPRGGDRRRARRPGRAAALPRLARQEGLRGGRLQLAPRRAAGRRAAPLPRRARRLERAAPRGRRPLRGARARRALRAAGRRGRATSTTCTSCARPSATGSARRSRRPGSATPRTTSRRSTCSPRCAYLGWQEGSLPETERPARENLALPMWAGIPAEAQERVVARDPRGRRGARVKPRASDATLAVRCRRDSASGTAPEAACRERREAAGAASPALEPAPVRSAR